MTEKQAHSTALGMKYWIGTITATGRMILPMRARALAGSRR